MKRLYKSRKDKVIDGVCAGIAEYFEVDPVLVRVVFVLFTIFGGMGLAAYIIGMIVIPRKPFAEGYEQSHPYQQAAPQDHRQEQVHEPVQEQPVQQPQPSGPSTPDKSSLLIGVVLVAVGALFLVDNFSIFHNFRPWYWFTRHFWDFLVPGLLIVAGVALLARNSTNK